MKHLLVFAILILMGCKTKTESQFSEKALNDSLVSLDGKSTPLSSVLNEHKGKTILIDVWATWCGDCIKGMPKVKALQKQYPDAVFLFLSIDDTLEELKTGIEKYGVTGTHYFVPSGRKGNLGAFLDLDWIPRYLVVNKTGNIDLFKSVEANDEKVLNAMKNNNP